MTTTIDTSRPTTVAPTDLPLHIDIAVIGGGLAGLIAVATAAQAGRSVALFERASALGGRARTREDHGFHLNIGPHALYRDGATLRILGELGVQVDAAEVGIGGGTFAVQGGRLHALPAGLRTLLTSRLLDWRGKLEALRFLAGLAKLDAAPLENVPLGAWLMRAFRSPSARRLVEVTVRTAAYASDPSLSAGAGLRQLQVGFSGARYLSGGWQSMVDGLRARAESLGVTVVSGARVTEIELEDDGQAIQAIRLADGRRVQADAAILAVPPQEASMLVQGGEHPALAAWAEQAVPVRAASLDVGLRRLPRPDRWFALGFDRPLYLSVHSRWASLAPEGGALVHVLKYHGADGRGPADEQELEDLLDLVQPGWRDAVVTRRFLPDVTVAGALPTVTWEQQAGPRSPAVPQTRGLFVAGDWVGPAGMLADRAATSGARAGAEAAALFAAASPLVGVAASLRDDAVPLHGDEHASYALSGARWGGDR